MPKTYKPILTDSITAAADIVKYRFVGFDGNLCAANAKAYGASEVDTKAGGQLSVTVAGIALVEAAGVIAAGGAVASNATGQAVAATAFSVSVPAGATAVTSTGAQPDLVEAGGVLPQAINGYAIDAAAAPGDIIRVRLV